MKEFSIFTLLKRFIYIFTLLIGLTFTSFAQNKTGDPVAKLLKFYPNPASTSITFDFNYGYDKSYSFQIYAFMGKKIVELKSVPPLIKILLDDYYRGIYLYKLLDRNGRVIESGKFLVVK